MPTLNKIYIDTHFHLDKYKEHKKIYEFLNTSELFTICVTNSPEEYVNCKNHYKETKNVKFALGYNPKISNETSFNKDIFNQVVDSTKIIGEIGLDFSNKSIENKVYQINVLEQILTECYNKNKIYTVHCNKAEKELYNILKAYGIKNFIIHWYTGEENDFLNFLKLGAYFSINTSIVKDIKNHDFLLNIPKDRILFESDGPYTNILGKTYNPSLIKNCYKEISEILKINNFNEVVYNNMQKLFTI